MVIKKEDVLKKLKDYLEYKITQEELVCWAEEIMQEKTFNEDEYDLLRNIVAKIGLSDVRAFGLTLEECGKMLNQLGYSMHMEILPTLTYK